MKKSPYFIKMKKIPIENWSNFDKLCLIHVIRRYKPVMGDLTWAFISRETKKLNDEKGGLIQWEKRTEQWFSPRQCAGNYELLVKSLGTRKKKRADKFDDEVLFALDEIYRRAFVQDLRQSTEEIEEEYWEVRKVREDYEAGRISKDVFEQHRKKWLEEEEEIKRNGIALKKKKDGLDIKSKLKSMLDEKNSENDSSKSIELSSLQRSPERKGNSTTSPLLTSLLQSPSPLVRPSSSVAPTISLLLHSSPPIPDSTLSKLLENSPSASSSSVSIPPSLSRPSAPESSDKNVAVESEIIIEQGSIPERTIKTRLPVTVDLEVECEEIETEGEVVETVEQMIERVEEAIIETVGEASLAEFDHELGQTQTVTIESTDMDQIDISQEGAMEVIVLSPSRMSPDGSTIINNETVIISDSPVIGNTVVINDSSDEENSAVIDESSSIKLNSEPSGVINEVPAHSVIIDSSATVECETVIISDSPPGDVTEEAVIIADSPLSDSDTLTKSSGDKVNTSAETDLNVSTEELSPDLIEPSVVIRTVDNSESTNLSEQPSSVDSSDNLVVSGRNEERKEEDKFETSSDQVQSTIAASPLVSDQVSEISSSVGLDTSFNDKTDSEKTVETVQSLPETIDSSSEEFTSSQTVETEPVVIDSSPDISFGEDTEETCVKSKKDKDADISTPDSIEIVSSSDQSEFENKEPTSDSSEAEQSRSSFASSFAQPASLSNASSVIRSQLEDISSADPSNAKSQDDLTKDSNKAKVCLTESTSEVGSIDQSVTDTDVCTTKDTSETRSGTSQDDETKDANNTLEDISADIMNNSGEVVITSPEESSPKVSVPQKNLDISSAIPEADSVSTDPTKKETPQIKRRAYPRRRKSCDEKNKAERESIETCDRVSNSSSSETFDIRDTPKLRSSTTRDKTGSMEKRKDNQAESSKRTPKPSLAKDILSEDEEAASTRSSTPSSEPELGNESLLKIQSETPMKKKLNESYPVARQCFVSVTPVNFAEVESRSEKSSKPSAKTTKETRFRQRSNEKGEREVDSERTTRAGRARRSGINVSIDSKPASPSPSVSSTDEDRDLRAWKKSIMLVFNRLASHKYASVFSKPIRESEAPGYSEVILRPMDLSTIKKNIDNGVIRTTVEFQRDMLLMVQNAIIYNKYDTPYYKMALEMGEDMLAEMEIMVQAIGDGVPLLNHSEDEKTKPRARSSKSGTEDSSSKKRKANPPDERSTKRIRTTSS